MNLFSKSWFKYKFQFLNVFELERLDTFSFQFFSIYKNKLIKHIT